MNHPAPHRRARSAARWYLWGVLLLLVFLAGFLLGGVRATGEVGSLSDVRTFLDNQSVGDNVQSSLFSQVWDAVRTRYVQQPVSANQLFYGSISGLVASLGDPYSVFLDPDSTNLFTEEISGSFEGIGAEIGIKDEQLVIIAPLPDTPADRAGLLANDAILSIDGEETSGMTIDEAVRRIRGDEGTTVVLLIARDGSEPKDVPIERGRIETVAVRSEMLDGNIGYIRVVHFQEDTDREFTAALSDLLLEQPAGLILDLRNNPGGFLDPAIDIVGHFVPEGSTVLIEEFSDGKSDAYRSDRRPTIPDLPVVVLVNGGSASASEIVAGALQDFDRATIIGTTTFGKGTVQDFETFGDGSSLKLTIARWLTPDGRSINDAGIVPDIEVTIADDERTDDDRDPQLEAAQAILLGDAE